MYESPINIISRSIIRQLDEAIDEAIVKAVQEYGISVNKDELLRALAYDREQYRKGYADAKAEQSWVPCKERLPDPEAKTYWICTDTGYQCECRWTNVNIFWTDLTTDWHWNIMDVPQYSKVVAWMPLPEPYKENKDERD